MVQQACETVRRVEMSFKAKLHTKTESMTMGLVLERRKVKPDSSRDRPQASMTRHIKSQGDLA